MVQLQKDRQQIEKAGIQVVAVSYDSPEVLREFSIAKRVDFPLLSDESSQAIDAYHVRNDDVRQKRFEGVPHPGTFLIGPDGKVKAKLFYDIRKRHSTNELIQASRSNP